MPVNSRGASGSTSHNRSRRSRSSRRSTSRNREDRNNIRKQEIAEKIKQNLIENGKYAEWVGRGSLYGRIRTVPHGNARYDVKWSDMNGNPVLVRDVSSQVTSNSGVRHIAVFDFVQLGNNVGLDD